MRGGEVRSSESANEGYDEHLGPEELRYLRKAADMFCDLARAGSADIAKHIAPATHVIASSAGVYVITDGDKAPMAAPFEGAAIHPLFGNWNYKYQMPHKPYMLVAAQTGATRAAWIFSHAIDAPLEDAGFK